MNFLILEKDNKSNNILMTESVEKSEDLKIISLMENLNKLSQSRLFGSSKNISFKDFIGMFNKINDLI